MIVALARLSEQPAESHGLRGRRRDREKWIASAADAVSAGHY
jgi:hypothetical protein